MLGLSRLRIGLLSSSASSIGGGGSFSPLSLFASGEQGAWYDPSDLTTMFQDTAGTTPVTATGQTVGLLLDKSQGLVLGPELIANGNFSAGSTGWTLSGSAAVVGGVATFNASGDRFAQNVVTPGKFYVIEYDLISTSANLYIEIGGAGGVAQTGVLGRKKIILFAASSSAFSFVALGPNKIDNVSVRELPGNHATQATAASRPIYGIEPFGGRRNLLVRTEEFDNAAWTKIAVTANGTEIRETTANSNHVIFQSVSLTGTYTFSLELQAVGRDVYTIWMGTSSGTFAFIYTFSTNTITSVGTALSNVTATVLSGGWVRFTGNVVTPNRFQVSVGNPSSSYVGDPANGFNIRNAQLEVGSTATAYQRVTDQWNVTQAGVPSVAYVAFDGTDDFMLTGTITPGTDKAQVFAGVRKLSDVATGLLVEFSTGVGSGRFEMFAPLGAATPNYQFRSQGTNGGSNAVSGFAAPITNVVTGIGDIATDTNLLRVNGAQVGSSTADQGTGNFLAYPLYVGRRGGTSLPFNGRIYGLAVRFGANLSAAQISQMETWMNARTGAF